MQESSLPEHHQIIPLENPVNGWGPKHKPNGKKLLITKEANYFLRNLNTYQRNEVYRAVSRLVTEGGYGASSGGFKLKPMFMRAKTDGIAAAGNLNLVYCVNSDEIVISSIGINKDAVGSKIPSSNESAQLYEVQRKNRVRYHEKTSVADLKEIENSWGFPVPTVEIKTEHAAVNGMLNDLNKATWLMGTHLDTAYWGDSPEQYTLFHNPTQGVFIDLFECVQDKISTSKVCRHLASVLTDCQRKGRKVKWICHSQGGIIFTRAVELVNDMGISLQGHKVVIHAGGNDRDRAIEAFKKAGIEVIDIDRDSPFDMVPNLAGGKDRSWSSFKRCLRFTLYVAGFGDRPMQTSPHTLPYLNLECSIRHLQMHGKHKAAKKLIDEQNRLGGC
ncbi:hypothetical protein EUZ85_18820 [Hahella sp. KA22]|uniref:hypothetical protein n=1 Tax=Hahella sp. KA22 TaxID=1628392 RepID=UPI000FDE2378|nr:hypothetical protein [Hahella sp. KA22]AZZ92666.1 hypothetical protein ENC22_16245 [Hahella sp. KA22]QAY56039.1 hypothetical protein EUZ85_18820 [Hahella sp. KA22]